MIRLKSLILDQPIENSVERATWWINYVIRNSGTVRVEKNANWKSFHYHFDGRNILLIIKHLCIAEASEKRIQIAGLVQIFDA